MTEERPAASAKTASEAARTGFPAPQTNWTNDPNGLVFFEGEYHLFYQYNPFGDVWGHMSWGHAVSTDLIHWQELPVAIPEADGVMIFTGSVVIDRENTSGFCLDGKPCMVAIYTGAHTAAKPPVQEQSIAYSNDRGRTWTKYAENPVLNLDLAEFRDPNVFWSAQGKRWIMAVSLPIEHRIAFYSSPDLKKWDRAGEFGPAGATSGVWECPDMFELPLDDKPGETRWVLKVGLNPGSLQGGSGEQYFVGRFDGSRFINDNPPDLTLWTDYGKDCYCALTFNNAPAVKPPVMLGWMNNWQYAGQVPTQPWRGQMTVARELSLRTFPEGIRLVQKPVGVPAGAEKNKAPQTGTFYAKLSVDPKTTLRAGWQIRSRDGSYAEIGYDTVRKEVYVDRTHAGNTGFNKDFPARTAAPYAASRGPISFEILVDTSSIEVFTADGRIALTNLVFFKPGGRVVRFSQGGAAKFQKAGFWPLSSIW